MTATCWPAATAVRAVRWTAGQPITACAPISIQATAHTLILGAEYHRFRNDLWTGAGGAAPLNPFSGYTAQTGHTVTYSDDNNRRYYQTGLYLQDEMVWNRWHVDVSARYDRIVSQQVSDTRGPQTAVQTTISAAAPRCCTPRTTVCRPT